MKKPVKLFFSTLLFTSLFFNSSCRHDNENVQEFLIILPDQGMTPVLNAIQKATSSIEMTNFHLSNKDVVSELINASARGVSVKIILDPGTVERSTSAQKIFSQLEENQIEVTKATKKFSITHQKSMVIDHKVALISTINLVTTFAKTRDFGLFTTDKDVIKEVENVFNTDWSNASDNTNLTPDLTVKRLLWSPVNSQDKLKSLIQEAKETIKIEVENLGSKEIIDTLVQKSKEGVKIQVLTPGCVIGDGLRNRPYMKTLEEGQIETRVSSAKSDSLHPYIHAKMILVDNKKFFIGSENFSYNSLTRAREVGIITEDMQKSATILETFTNDWKSSVAPDSISEADCKAQPF